MHCDIVMQTPPFWASIVISQQVHKRWNLQHSRNNKYFLILMKPLVSANKTLHETWRKAQHFPQMSFEKTCLKPGLSQETNTNPSYGIFNPRSLEIYFPSQIKANNFYPKVQYYIKFKYFICWNAVAMLFDPQRRRHARIE